MIEKEWTGRSLVVGTHLNGRPKTSVEKNGNHQVKKEEATKGTDLNGREPLRAGAKWIVEKVGADLNGREPTISKMMINNATGNAVESEEMVGIEWKSPAV